MRDRRILGSRPAPVAPLPLRAGTHSVTFNCQKCDNFRGH